MKRKQAYLGMLHPLVFKRSSLPITLLFLFLSIVIHAQVPQNDDTYVVRGQVLSSEDGSPLPGVSVQIKGSLTGISTKENGEFTLTTRNSQVTISFSYLGYRTLDTALTLPLLNPLVVKLTQDAAMLDETVVIGYGTTTRRLNTGSVGRVTAEEIGRQPVGNVLGALQGKIPGLMVTQSGGLPGSDFEVRIRGRNSIDSGNEPLFIVDGVPVPSNSLSQIQGTAGSLSPFYSLNPADIASVEVLKDADATAIYGSRGANGVILITTKRGHAGKARVDVNLYSGMGEVTRTMDLMNTKQYVEMRHEALENDGLTPAISNAPDLLLWDTARYTDWKELLIGNTAHINNAKVSIAGGNSATTFRLAGGYRRETNVFPGNLADRRASVQMNVNHASPDEKLQVTMSANYAHDHNEFLPRDLTNDIMTAPNAPAHNEKGEVVWSEGGAMYANPLAFLLTSFSAVTENLVSNLTLSYKVTPELLFKISAGYTNTQLDETSLHPKKSYTPSLNRTSGNSRFGTNTFKSWILEPQLTYKIHVAGGELNSLIGTSWQQELSEGHVIHASNYSSEALLNSTTGAATITTSDSHAQYRYQSVFLRMNYKYNEKYLLNLTGRRDGSSRFGPRRQYANFGALGAAWIFSEESFIKNRMPFLSFGKIRGSYGVTGNDKIGDYQYLDVYGETYDPYQGMAGLIPLRLFNPTYGWETNRKLEGALELGFLADRILLSTSWFRNRSGNQLLDYSLPVQTGFSGITRNLPALVQNTGWEFELNTINVLTSKLQWKSSLNVTIARNKLLEFPDLEKSSYATTYVLGKPLDIEKLYHYEGVDPETGVYQFDIDAGRTVVKGLTPTYYGGFNNILRFKGIQVEVFFQFSKKEAPSYLYSLAAVPGVRGYNQPVYLLNRWTQVEDVTDLQRFTTGSTDASRAFSLYYRYSDGAYTDASYIRLKNISISYDLPSSWIQRLRLDKCRIYLQGRNLLTLTNYKGNDPEVPNLRRLPPLRMITAGLQFTF